MGREVIARDWYEEWDGMEVILKKDIVIPAGTVLTKAAVRSTRHGKGHVECSVEISPDNTGMLTLYVDPDDAESMEEYFERRKA